MDIKEELKPRFKLLSSSIIHEEVFKKLVENTFATLLGNQELHNINTLYNSKPDIVKGVYAALLTAAAEFGRNDLDSNDVQQFLVKKCNCSASRANYFADLYSQNKRQLQVKLGNIGMHLPHVTDVAWKIDYVIKTDVLDQAGGPVFRIAFITDEYDEVTKCKKTRQTEFSCNSQELQDLVYKLKDAVRHCQRIVGDH